MHVMWNHINGLWVKLQITKPNLNPVLSDRTAHMLTAVADKHFLQGSDRKYFRRMGHVVFFTMTQLCCCSKKAILTICKWWAFLCFNKIWLTKKVVNPPAVACSPLLLTSVPGCSTSTSQSLPWRQRRAFSSASGLVPE